VERNGAVASILELGMGFHPDFTGRENARMNAALLGLTGPEIRRRLPEIRDFAELGEFFDSPVRTYSSGMVLRLAFAVATHADAEVLIVDEALAVGDGYFQKKSVDRITEFHRRGGTLLFCSHALYYVALLCDTALWLKNGVVAAQGPALPVVRAYEAFLQQKERALTRDEPPGPVDRTDGRRPARLTEVLVHDGSGYPRTEFAAGETVAVDLAFETRDPSLRFHLRVGVDREDGVQVFTADTRREPWAPLTGRDRYRLRLLFPELPVAQGDFRLYAYLGDETALHVHDVRILKPGFSVASPEYVVGLVAARHLWTFPEAETAPPARVADGVAASS
jgi:ABC-type multidrug transport system ATPase subunit